MSYSVSLEWYPEKFIDGNLATALAAGINAAAIECQSAMKGNVVPRPSPSLETRMAPTDRYPRKGRGGGYVSAAGMRPTTQTGVLRSSIRVWPATANALMAKVGTMQKHGLFLERGTRRMAARPFVGISATGARARMTLAFLRTARSNLSAIGTRAA